MKAKVQFFLTVCLLVLLLFIFSGCSKETSNDKINKSNLTNSSNSLNTTNSTSNTTSTLTPKNMASQFLANVKKLTSDQIEKNAQAQMALPEDGEQIAIMHIKDYGDVTIKFFSNVAPKAVENFVTHSKDGYYNGVTFHRIISDFMIQGGDPLGNGTGGESIWKSDFDEELDSSILPYRGSLCMASRGTATTSLGSQFFINTTKYDESNISELTQYLSMFKLTNLYDANLKYGGNLAMLVGYAQYTTFGQVIDGMDIIDKISNVETDSNDKPINDVIISSIEITNYSK